MTCPQKLLEIPQMPKAVLAIDTKGHSPVTSKGNRWALTALCFHTTYVFMISMRENVKEMLFKTINQVY